MDVFPVQSVPPEPENNQIAEQRRITETIKDTREKLDKIKKELEEKREKRNETQK